MEVNQEEIDIADGPIYRIHFADLWLGSCTFRSCETKVSRRSRILDEVLIEAHHYGLVL